MYTLPSNPAIKTRRFLLVKPVAASGVWHKAPARAITRGWPNRRAGVLHPSTSVGGARPAQRLGSQGRCSGRHVRFPAYAGWRRGFWPRARPGWAGVDPVQALAVQRHTPVHAPVSCPGDRAARPACGPCDAPVPRNPAPAAARARRSRAPICSFGRRRTRIRAVHPQPALQLSDPQFLPPHRSRTAASSARSTTTSASWPLPPHAAAPAAHAAPRSRQADQARRAQAAILLNLN